MIEDLNNMLALANKHKIAVILVLWDFYINTTQAKGLYTNSQNLDSYITNALIPLLRGVEENTNIIAFEIINEPEWIVMNDYGTWD